MNKAWIDIGKDIPGEKKQTEKFKLGLRRVQWPGSFGTQGSDGEIVTVMAERQTEPSA